MSALSEFSDKEQISENLRKYLAIAVQKEIMRGEKNKEGKRTINPQAPLTRAQLAALIHNTLMMEKVTFDEEVKVTDESPILLESTCPPTPKTHIIPTLKPVQKPEYQYPSGQNEGDKKNW